MFVCCESCVLSGRGLCDELITRPEESYRLWCVVVCDLENLVNEEAMTRVGSQRHKKNCSFSRILEEVLLWWTENETGKWFSKHIFILGQRQLITYIRTCC